MAGLNFKGLNNTSLTFIWYYLTVDFMQNHLIDGRLHHFNIYFSHSCINQKSCGDVIKRLASRPGCFGFGLMVCHLGRVSAPVTPDSPKPFEWTQLM